ncbi:ABC transporter substrate-binding protein [Halogranum rubrum]|uniref:Dipeptide ABC transporter dipeptide-binding protein n=1 Tax=Halogranum salarium B-1 TaxID=1210908 RepID=J2ZHG9_9EURY|nr:ABC transporter substrate-binding protein [Halogranum salarium]EJN60155.1 dipeptide ABC transporter dipeptide-binding protein [Halogranum salarium B-1]
MTTHDKTTRRRFLQAAGGVGASLALAGCTGSESDGESTPAANGSATSEGTETGTSSEGGEAGTLNLINSTLSSLDPISADDTASGAVTTQLFDGLMTYPNGEVPVEAVIAEDYETSEDFTTYTFSLKEGVTFHNGTEVTAADFVYSYERLAASSNSRTAADILQTIGVVHEVDGDENYVPESLAVEAVDDYTVEITIEQPFAPTLQVLSNNQFAAVPEGIVGDVEGYDGEMEYNEFASSNPVGAGPFTFDAWQEGTDVSVSAYDDYHGDVPQLDGVRWQIIEDDNAIYNYAMNENADAFDIPTAKFDRGKLSVDETDDRGRRHGTYGPVRNGKTVNYLGVPTLSVYYIGFNMEAVEKPVRQAVAHALNQQTVVEQVFKRRGVPAYHYMTPGIYPGGAEGYGSHAEESYPYGYNESQLDEARALMEEAGYGPDNPYELEFLIYESTTWEDTGKLLRDQLASAHIEMTITKAPFSALLSRVRKMDVQAYSLGWVVPWAAPDAFVKHLNPAASDPTASGAIESYNQWPTDTEAAQNAIDAWNQISENRAPTDEAEQLRAEAAVEMEEANWADVANLPVYHQIEERFWYDRVSIPPFGIGGMFKQKYNGASFE